MATSFGQPPKTEGNAKFKLDEISIDVMSGWRPLDVRRVEEMSADMRSNGLGTSYGGVAPKLVMAADKSALLLDVNVSWLKYNGNL